MKYDIVLRNAHVIDPSQQLNGVSDVAISGGRIANIEPGLAADPEVPQEDLSRLYLAPGLVDLHGHWYEGSAFGIDPHLCLAHGVTTAVDAGTTGFINFAEFHRTRLESAQIGLFAFLNISGMGIPSPILNELGDLRIARAKEAAEVLLAYPRELVGIKVRVGKMSGDNGLAALARGLEAAEASRTPVMVHISKSAPTRQILDALRPGDVLTHCYQGRGDGLIPDGNVLGEAIEARRRGVLFDTGHGCASFCWDTARAAFEHFFYPDTISTDLHRFSYARWCYDLPTTMSKFLHLGMALEDVILKTTWIPARAIRREGEIGTLRPGAAADLFVFAVEEGEFPLEDTHGKVVVANRHIRPRRVMRGGKWVETGGARPPRPLLDCDYEVFRDVEESL